MPKKLVLVGCGNLGTMILYNTCLRLNETPRNQNPKFDEIEIIDPGIVSASHKNIYPINVTGYPGLYRTTVLKLSLSEMFPKIKVTAKTNIVKTMTPTQDDLIIDCRDDSSRINCYAKLSCEGNFGRIVYFPELKPGKQFSYSLNRSVYYAGIMSYKFCSKIFLVQHPFPLNGVESEHLIDLSI